MNGPIDVLLKHLGLEPIAFFFDDNDLLSAKIIDETISVKIKNGRWTEVEPDIIRLGLVKSAPMLIFWIKADRIDLEGEMLCFCLREDSWTKGLARLPELLIKIDCIERLGSISNKQVGGRKKRRR